MVKFMMIGMLLALATGIAACETVKGLGKDITNAGQAVQDKF